MEGSSRGVGRIWGWEDPSRPLPATPLAAPVSGATTYWEPQSNAGALTPFGSRGLSPWPVAQTTLEGKKVKLISSRVSKLQGNPGEVVSVNPLTVACKEGSVEILTLQLEGKKAMESKAFLLGHKLNIGDKFG